MSISTNIEELKNLSALKIGQGEVRVAHITSRDQLVTIHEVHKSGEQIHISGDGTNTVYGSYDGIVVILDTQGYEWVDEQTLKIEGGEPWQRAVDISVAANKPGIERLTRIPGRVGAAPVQNIGAFGQLLSERIQSIEIYDYVKDSYRQLSASECGFGRHRASAFKSSEWQSYVIISITISLLPDNEFTEPTGEGLMSYAHEHGVEYSTIIQAEKLISEFRTTLYPDYKSVPNCGSYFTNYEVPSEKLDTLPNKIWDLKHRVTQNGATMFQCKNLLESVGVGAGYVFDGGLMMHPVFNNFLINPDQSASPRDLVECHKTVNNLLSEAYGIELIPEPEFIGSL